MSTPKIITTKHPLFSNNKVWNQDYAKIYLSLPAIEGEREIIQENVAFLLSEIESGNFLEFCIKTLEYNGVVYKCNGQHQSTAALLAKIKEMPATIVHYVCDTKQEAITIYKKTDTHTGRTLEHCVDIERKNAGGAWKEAKPRVALLAVGGLLFRRYGKAGRSLTKSTKADVVRMPNSQKLVAFFTAVFSGKSRHLFREPIAAAMTNMFYKDPDAALEFWLQVRDAENLPATAWTKQLHDWLISPQSRRRSYSGTREHIVPWNELYGRCVIAWNNYRNKTKLAWRKKHLVDLPKVS